MKSLEYIDLKKKNFSLDEIRNYLDNSDTTFFINVNKYKIPKISKKRGRKLNDYPGLEDYILDGLTHKEIGTIYNVTRSRAGEICHSRGYEEIRKEAKKENKIIKKELILKLTSILANFQEYKV